MKLPTSVLLASVALTACASPAAPSRGHLSNPVRATSEIRLDNVLMADEQLIKLQEAEEFPAHIHRETLRVQSEVANVTTSLHLEKPSTAVAMMASFPYRGEFHTLTDASPDDSDQQEAAPAHEPEPIALMNETPIRLAPLASKPDVVARELMSAQDLESERIIKIYIGIMVVATLSLMVFVPLEDRRIRKLHEGL